MSYTIYSYGGGKQLEYVFNGIAAMFKHSTYEYAFYIAATLFGIWVLVTSIIRNQAMVPIKWMFWFWISTTLMLTPKTTIFIFDPITKFERKIDNVPFILGMFAGVISGIGHSMTDAIEMFFRMPNYQKYGENGMMFASKLLKNMDKYRIRNGTLRENMSRFIDQCVVLESMMGGKYTVKDLHESNNIWELVKNNANQINGFSYRDKEKNTEILSCKEGAAKLEKDLHLQTKSLATYFGRQYMPNRDKTTANSVFENFFKEKMSNSYQFMSDIAVNAEDILKQEMMINAIEDTKMSYAVAKANIQQRAWYLTLGELTSDFLVGLKVVLESLAYAGFLFIAIMVMLPTGINILGKYLQILIWLQLWSPLYAVLNMVMSTIAQHKTQGLLGGEDLNMMTSIGLISLQDNMEAIAAFCTASIPFISYSLLQGGVGSFMHLAGTMTSAMSGAASSTSSEISSGNLSLNSVTYGGRAMMNVGGFKHDTGLSYRSGRMEMEKFDGSQGFITPAGKLGVVAGSGYNISKLPDSMSASRMINAGLDSRVSYEKSQAENHTDNFEKHRATAHNHSIDLLESMSHNIGQNRSWQTSNSSRNAESISTTANFTKQLQENHGLTDRQAAEVTASIGFGRILPFSPNSSFSSQAARDRAISQGKSLAESNGLTKQMEVGINHLDEVRYSEGEGKEKRIANSLRTELNEMEKSSKQASYHRNEADRYQRTKSLAESIGIGISEDATEKFIDFVANHQVNMGHGEVFGRDRAMQVISNRESTDYSNLLQKFANTFAEERIAQLEQNTTQHGPHETEYKTSFNKVISTDVASNSVVDIDKEFDDKKQQYQTHKSGNIVQNVIDHNMSNHAQIDKEKTAMNQEKQSLKEQYEKEDNTKRISRAVKEAGKAIKPQENTEKKPK